MSILKDKFAYKGRSRPNGSGVLSDKEATVVGKRIEQIAARNGLKSDDPGGPITVVSPELLVEDAFDQSSPLHKHFTWDNREAAHNWRLHEARSLIQLIEVVRIGDDGKEKSVRAFHSITIRTAEGVTAKGYAHVDAVSRSVDASAQVKAAALRELRGWRKRYEDYLSLLGLAEDLDALERKIDPEEAA